MEKETQKRSAEPSPETASHSRNRGARCSEVESGEEGPRVETLEKGCHYGSVMDSVGKGS